MEPICKPDEKTCYREICTLDVRQHEKGVIDVPKESIQCTHSNPELESKPENAQEKEVIENIEKQIINQSISFDREVQMPGDHNDRPFVAVRANQSDYCPGCPYELNPSLPGLSAFGNQALRSMDDAGISDFKHKLISIVRVTRAVPPGSDVVQYQLLMEIGESNCLRTSHIEISECPLQSNLPIKLCLVTFEERPWLTGSRKITKNNCTDLLNTDNEVIASVNPNSLIFESTPPNKEEDVSTKTEFYDQIAQEAQEVIQESPHTKIILEKTNEPPKFSEKMKEFDEFLDDFNIPIKTETTSPQYLGVPVTEELIKAERVEDKIKDENKATPISEPSEQTADMLEEVEQSQNPVLNPTVETIRSKRSIKSSGNNKLMLKKLTVQVIESLDDDEKNKELIDIIETKRERQDHSIIFHVTAEVISSKAGVIQICKFNIATNEKKPLKSPKLLHYNCKNKEKSDARFKRQMLGALTKHSSDDPEVKKYVQLGLQKYSENFEGIYEPMISTIKDVKIQVVSGLLYKIKTDIGVSTCKKGNKDNCQLKADEGVKECVIEAWSQPWMDNGNPRITVKCNENKRKKRALKGQNYSEKMLEQSRLLKEEKLFHEFIKKYEKYYASEEERTRRFTIFKKNLDMIEELQRNEQGTGRYGVTQFADLTKAEFKAKYLGLKPSLKSDNDIPMPMAEIPDIELPTEFDWRHHNVVTPVKNQGGCGSCWAFSVTGNVEGQYAIKHGELLSFSEQELVDCDKHDDGCNGGLPDTAYRAIEELGGLETESDYPYDAQDEKCHFNKNKIKATVVSGLNITSNETQMAQWLVKNGPMSIGINANAMQFYVGGVSHPFHFLCSPDDLDHGVLIVGYGIKCK